MNPILALVYRFLQGLCILSLRIYFRKIVYLNRQHLTADGPLVVVCNHPNTVVDPLLAVMYTREKCFLLANYSLFKNPIAGAILRTLFCIPVKRTQDVAAGEIRNNDDAFRESREHLTAGRSLFVAPEGTSFTERHVREFKTGAARIILEAESKANFALNVRVLPIGLTYYDPLKFGSDVVVEVGAPFSAKNWQQMYAENPLKAAEDFTQFLENQFHTLSIHCADVQEDHFLQKIEAVVQSEKPLELIALTSDGVTQSHPVTKQNTEQNTEGVYFRSKQLLSYIQDWKKTDIEGFDVFKNEVETYFLKLEEHGLKDVNVKKKSTLDTLTALFLSIPAFILGTIPNFLPAWFSHNLVKWLKLDSAYDTTVRLLSGVFIFFPILWWLETRFVFTYFVPKLANFGFFQTILLIMAYIMLGLLAWRIYTEGVSFLNYQRYKRADADGSLTKLRAPIVDKLYFFCK